MGSSRAYSVVDLSLTPLPTTCSALERWPHRPSQGVGDDSDGGSVSRLDGARSEYFPTITTPPPPASLAATARRSLTRSASADGMSKDEPSAGLFDDARRFPTGNPGWKQSNVGGGGPWATSSFDDIQLSLESPYHRHPRSSSSFGTPDPHSATHRTTMQRAVGSHGAGVSKSRKSIDDQVDVRPPTVTNAGLLIPAPPVYLEDLLAVVKPFITPQLTAITSGDVSARDLEPTAKDMAPLQALRQQQAKLDKAPLSQIEVEIPRDAAIPEEPRRAPPAPPVEQARSSLMLHGTASFGEEHGPHTHRRDASALKGASDPVSALEASGLVASQDVVAATRRPQESLSADYVIANYYPSEGSPSTHDDQLHSPPDYPLKSRLSARRRSSFERPAMHHSLNERPWRHSDSSSRSEWRPAELEGLASPDTGHQRRWSGATASINNSTTARRDRMNLPAILSAGAVDHERLRTPIGLDGRDLAELPAEAGPAQSRITSKQDETQGRDYTVAPLAVGARKDRRWHQHRQPPGYGQARSSLAHQGGSSTFRSAPSHLPPALLDDGVEQAPPLPRRASARNRQWRDESPRQNDKDARAGASATWTQASTHDRRASVPSNPAPTTSPSRRNSSWHEITEQSVRMTPAFNNDRPARPQLATRQPARHNRVELSAGTVHTPSQAPTGRDAASVAVDHSHVRSVPAAPVRSGASSNASSAGYGRPRLCPSIDEDRVSGDGTSQADHSYGPSYMPYGSASGMSSTQISRNHSSTTNGGRNLSTPWSRTTSGGHWTDQSSISSHTRMKTAMVPSALFQQALALKPLPPPPPPSKTPSETHPLLERNRYATLNQRRDLPDNTTS